MAFLGLRGIQGVSKHPRGVDLEDDILGREMNGDWRVDVDEGNGHWVCSQI